MPGASAVNLYCRACGKVVAKDCEVKCDHCGAKTSVITPTNLVVGMFGQLTEAEQTAFRSRIGMSLAGTGPANLVELLESQVERMLGIWTRKDMGMAKARYTDKLRQAVNAFSWSPEHEAIGLTEVCLADYRLRGEFLAEVTNTYCWLEPDECKNFTGIETPDGIFAFQAQWGWMHKNHAPQDCRGHFNPLEQGNTVKDGFFGILHYGMEGTVDRIGQDLSGSVSPGLNVPNLYRRESQPGLCVGAVGIADLRYGSGSRGRTLGN